MSLILCIETGTDVCSVGIAKDGELLSLRESDEGRDHARKVGVFVDELLRETGIAPDELDAVAVGKGPGSYTGLRIGVSFAKGLCYGVRKPLVAVGSLDALAEVALEDYEAGILSVPDWEHACLCPMVDARRMEVYAQALELESGVFVNRVTPEVERLAHMVAHPVPEQTDLRALFERSECCQMCFYLDTEAERRVMAQLPGLAASRWCPIFADINVAGIDKATGMREFMSACGLRASEVAAFGDGGNDVAMLSAAGVGIAMGNACDEALNAADYVTATVDDDGIARALEHLGILDD